MPGTSVLLVDSDRASADAIADVLRSAGHDVAIANDYSSARRQLERRGVIVLSGPDKRTRPLDLCRDIRSEPVTAILPILGIVAPEAAEERVRWIDAGADDVLVRPFDPRELEARIDALLVRYERSQELTAPAEGATKARNVISFVGAKGGIGTTSATVNVARAIIELRPGAVAIVDTDLQRGQVATQLNLTPSHGLVDAAVDTQALNEPDLIDQYVQRHSSGLAVLAGPPTPEPDSSVSPDALRRIVAGLAERHEIVVVDAGSRLDERTVAAVENSDQTIFLLAPDIASLRAMKTLVQALGSAGVAVSRPTFVLNHLYEKELLRRPEIETALGARIRFELPYDSVLYQNAVNQGVPLVRGAPDSAPADAFRRLAALLLRSAQPEQDGREPRGRRRLAGVLKRSK